MPKGKKLFNLFRGGGTKNWGGGMKMGGGICGGQKIGGGEVKNKWWAIQKI